MKLNDYINANYVSKAEFARLINVRPQRITEMINADMRVYDGMIVSIRKILPAVKLINELEK